ncbi:MAG: hypothetical protein AAFU71_10555 [Cyanobacteria bacterium J06632_22]
MNNTTILSENLKQIKTEGGQRSQKIGQIFRAAFVEAAAEVKAGTQTVRPLAKDLADVATETARFKGQQVSTNVRKAFTETAVEEEDLATRLQLKLQAIIKAIRDTLLSSWNREADAPVLPVEKETGADSHDGVTVETLAA